MGACCSKDVHYGEVVVVETVAKKRNHNNNDEEEDEEENDEFIVRDYGAHMRLQGFSRFVSMYTQQGRKGVNQDAMTVWEEFTGEKDMFFCGVFDGHGPYGHKVSRHVRDTLPSRLSERIKNSSLNNIKYRDAEMFNGSESGDNLSKLGIKLLSQWEAAIIKCFNEMDEELSVDASIDSFCSGSTAVTVLKQGKNLIVANLGDSRAVLCTRNKQNQLVPVQLTVDLKPSVPSEAERIKSRKGRIFALEEEPNIPRVWMPDEDCPGLAMARAFGDFCLKDYGLTSVPEVTYRRITDSDEFVVLATDGIWDVLSNAEVVKIVASSPKRSVAAKMLVKHAVRRWRTRHPNSKIDDCAVVCLFLKNKPLARSYSELSQISINHTEVGEGYSEVSRASVHRSEIAAIAQNPAKRGSTKPAMEGSSPRKELDRINTMVKHPRLAQAME